MRTWRSPTGFIYIRSTRPPNSRKNEELAWGEWGAALQKHEAPVALGSFPAFGDAERKDLARGFGGKTWTGLNLYD
jgi:hypothetical protein